MKRTFKKERQEPASEAGATGSGALALLASRA